MPSVISVPSAPVVAPIEQPTSTPAPAPETPQEQLKENAEEHFVEVKSPMVGTFYRASSPDKPAYIKVGDQISEGDVLCIIEAMKLFNEIESEISGKVVKILVDDASPVEYEQPLFLVDPNG